MPASPILLYDNGQLVGSFVVVDVQTHPVWAHLKAAEGGNGVAQFPSDRWDLIPVIPYSCIFLLLFGYDSEKKIGVPNLA